MQTRREFLRAAGLAVGSGVVFSVLPGCSGVRMKIRAKGRRPNVVLVITDDQGYGDLSCHGNTILKTPNLDKLHSQSMRLTDFHVNPTCSPTRAALMTGRYCNRTGVWHTIMGRSLLREDEVTMADVFKASGYRTGIFGKWHLGDNYPFRPIDRGFDDALVHRGGGIGNTQDYWDNDYFDDTYFRNSKPEKFEGYCTDVWFAEAMKFIEANKDRPFFCYLTTNAPHGPFRVPEEYSKPYEDKGINANFYGMIANIDENFGRLEAKLKELGLDADTIVIFMTDNGTAAGTDGDNGYGAGMRGRKGSQYDGGHRVPFFIRWPGVLDGGRDVDRLTAHIDVLPTLIDLCRLEEPADVAFDGRSLVPLLAGRDDWPDRVIVTDSQRVDHPRKWRKTAVMTDRWRLLDGNRLYDIKADPAQENGDVSPKYPMVKEKLRQEYDKWWDDVSERFGEYCCTIVGSDAEKLTKLTSHDWHADGPWNQGQIRKGEINNGFWAIDVARDGEYEFAFRRWPREVRIPLGSALSGAKRIRARLARIRITAEVPTEYDYSAFGAEYKTAKGEYYDDILVNSTQQDAKFRLKLKAGKAFLQTWLEDREGKTVGAYYVYVRRLV